MNPLQHSLGRVAAGEDVKERTKAFLAAQPARRGNTRVPRLAAALACLLLTLTGVGGWLLYRTPVSFVSIDVNPSLELAVNRFDRVVGTTAYNDDGAAVLSGLSVRGMTCADAIDALAADPLFRSYVEDGAQVVFTVVSDREEQLRADITGGEGFRACGGEYVQADAYCLEQAHANGLSLGKYYVYEELSLYGSDVTIEDCHHMSIGQLRDELARCSGHGSHHGASGTDTVQPSASPSASAYPGWGGHSHGHGHGGHHSKN